MDMATKRRFTQELLKARAHGRQIVVSSGVMYYPHSKTHEWPVVYRPRYTTDAQPWLALLNDGSIPEDGKGMRYSGRECTVESRWVANKVGAGQFIVRDLQLDMDEVEFVGENAYRKADLYALSRNRDDRERILQHKD
jgi:hypothetical protein